MKLEKYFNKTKKRGLDIPIDYNSNRYRCCPYCQYEFMAEDLREKYCCDACREDFNNEQKRLAITGHITSNQILTEKQAVEAQNVKQDLLDINIQLIEQLFQEENKNEVYISCEELDKKGLNFSINNGQGDLYNTPNEANCKFLIIGSYHLFRVSFDTMLIVNSKII